MTALAGGLITDDSAFLAWCETALMTAAAVTVLGIRCPAVSPTRWERTEGALSIVVEHTSTWTIHVHHGRDLQALGSGHSLAYATAQVEADLAQRARYVDSVRAVWGSPR